VFPEVRNKTEEEYATSGNDGYFTAYINATPITSAQAAA
jgi:hypothetical protein